MSKISLILLFGFFSFNVNAEVFKCVDKENHTLYQKTPCTGNLKSKEVEIFKNPYADKRQDQQPKQIQQDAQQVPQPDQPKKDTALEEQKRNQEQLAKQQALEAETARRSQLYGANFAQPQNYPASIYNDNSH